MILVKMLLLLFLDDVASERELVEVIRERLDYLWFLGYGLDDEVPNHSVLSKARARWGREVFCQLFVRTVERGVWRPGWWMAASCIWTAVWCGRMPQEFGG